MNGSITSTPQPQTSIFTTFRRYLPLIAGIICMIILIWANAFPIDTAPSSPLPTRIQLALLTAAIVLIAWGVAGSPRFSLRGIDRREVVVVLLIALVALFIRLWGLDSTLRLLLDESNFVAGADGAYGSPNLLLYFPMSGISPYTWLYPETQADMMSIFGRNLTGLRAASSFLGTANVIAVYILARALFNRRTALIAAVALAALPVHLHYSRIALLQPGDALMGTLALAFVARGLKTRRPLDWGIAGVALGLTHYYFEAGRLLFTPLVAIWLIWLMLTDPASRSAIRGGVIRLGFAAFLIALPVYTTIIAFNRPLTGRLDDSGVGISYWTNLIQDGITDGEQEDAIRRLTNPFLFIVARPEQGSVYFGGTEPLVLRILVPLFAIGVVVALAKWRKPQVLPAGWLLAVLLANAFLIRDSATSPRYIVATPALALLIALGIVGIGGFFERLQWRRVALFAMSGLTLGAAVIQIAYYFGPHLDYLNDRHRIGLTYGDVWDAVMRLNDELPRETQGIYVGRPNPPHDESSSFLNFLQHGNLYSFRSYEPGAITPKLLRNLSRQHGYAFFVEARHTEIFQLLYRYFPDAHPPRYSTTDMAPFEEYILVYVPPW